MNKERILKEKLKVHFDWHGARLMFLAMFINTIFVVRSVNFTKIANKFPGFSSQSSKYKRIQRFFRFFEIDYIQIAKFIAFIVPNANEKWILSIDRTNWKFGFININILTLGITYEGIAFPLLWVMLDKRGNSNTQERINLLNKFIEIFSLDKIECLLADREFIGEKWFDYLLNTKKINFRIRIKNCEYINKIHGGNAPVRNFFRNIKIGQTKNLKYKRLLWNHYVFLSGTKSSDGSLVIIATNSKIETSLKDYAKRWEIETLFKCLKSSGFNFEDTHLRNIERINKLMALLSIAFCWAYLVGDWKHKKNPIKLKTHGRKERSIFRLGLDILGELVFFGQKRINQYRKVIHLLSCT